MGHHRRGPRHAANPLTGVYSGGDAARGGSTAIRAAGDGKAAAHEIVGDMNLSSDEIARMVASAGHYTNLGAAPQTILEKIELADGIVEFIVHSPAAGRQRRAGQFVRVLPWPNGELIPLTLADWDAKAGTICLVVQAMGTSSIEINRMAVGDAFTGIAGPLGRPSDLHRYEGNQTKWYLRRAASACRRFTQSCGNICAWATTSL